MTKLELLEYLERVAREYRLECRESLIRNAHMNDLGGECEVDQKLADAILVDFINKVGTDQWVDYGLYTKDFVKIRSSITHPLKGVGL
jgi:hypothetical protein